MELRDYQTEAVEKTFDYFDRRSGDPVIVAPTGAGKSLIIAGVIRESMRRYPGTRLLVLTHVKELVAQNADKMRALCPELASKIGVYSAGLGIRDTVQPIIFGNIQSLYRRTRELGHRDLCIIDEAHLIPHSGGGMYRSLIAKSRMWNESMRVLGLTATPFRADSGLLTVGKDRLFSSVCYNVDTIQLIDDGYLSPLTTEEGCVSYDTSAVEVRGGDFLQSALAKKIHASQEITISAVKDIIERSAHRKKWVIFCATCPQAELVAQLMKEGGISAECLTGETPTDHRDRMVKSFRGGALRCLVNVNILTTGFDAPETDMVALLRPTKSPVIYCQALGRGMRIAPDKTDCLVLDYGNNLTRHGPINKIKAKKQAEVPGDAPIKICDNCMAEIAAGFRRCPECDYEFPERDVELHKVRERGEYVERDEKWYEISRIRYSKHVKVGKPPSFKVEYYSGLLAVASEWVCVEHFGFAKTQAEKWFRVRSEVMPTTVDDALEICGDLLEPTQICVDNSGKYARVKGYKFEGDEDDDSSDD